MKRFLFLVLFIPLFSSAQSSDTTCTYDMYNCYLHAIRAFLNGSSGLEDMHSKQMTKKTATLYIVKRYYTSGFPDVIEGHNMQYIDIEGNEELLHSELKTKTGTLLYMSELNIGAEMCDLWLMPIYMKKQGNVISPEYTEKGCHLYFRVCKETGKLGYAKTFCPPADKD